MATTTVAGMDTTTPTWPEATVERRLFPTWSIRIPVGLEENFHTDEGYWHAWDEHRSVSATSMTLTDGGRPVRAKRILRRMRSLPGMDGPTVVPPDGLLGWAVEIQTPPGSRASRAVTGIVVVDGRLLLVTVTSDDIAWATRVWLSIRERSPLEVSSEVIGRVGPWTVVRYDGLPMGR